MDIKSIKSYSEHVLLRIQQRELTSSMLDYVLKYGVKSSGADDCIIVQGKVPEKQRLELRLVINNFGKLVTACWRRSKNNFNPNIMVKKT